ncbi:hypothetical protein CLIM01_14340 [Colletotrichum limetticola]|uniref:Uncharacterized protein n=1 Tax=Colletotrichum limetticola TaxID=1209924 RepID=A0ABQ9P864_9PEZI|nr:hypothetical protein CLIM01_14340 [Colletotrichum limetticola]
MVEHTAATTSGFGQQSPKKSNDDDVVYIGTFKVKDTCWPTHTTRRRTERSRLPCRDQAASTKPGPGLTRRRRTDTASAPKMAADLTYKYIRLGETKGSAGSTRAVYGFSIAQAGSVAVQTSGSMTFQWIWEPARAVLLLPMNK